MYRYENIHDDDLKGMKAVQNHFWDKGRPQIKVYLRRRTIDGDWIWLAADVVSYIDNPVPGYILHECKLNDESMADVISRTTRITAMLIDSVLESREDQMEGMTGKSEKGDVVSDTIPGVADDAAALQTLLRNAADSMGINLTDSSNPLQQLMEAAANGGAIPSDNATKESGLGAKGKSNEVLSLLDVVRIGHSVDLNKIILSLPELKMVVLVLTGRLQVEELAPLVLDALKSPDMDLSMALAGFLTEREMQQAIEQSNQSPSGRKGSSRRAFIRDNSSKDSSLYVPPSWGERGRNQTRSLSLTSIPNISATFYGDRHIQENTVSAQGDSAARSRHDAQAPLHAYLSPTQQRRLVPPRLSVVNLSFTNIGNQGIEMLSEVLYTDTKSLKTLDISFCGVKEGGVIALCRALRKRKKRLLPSLQGLVLSGNFISYKAAKELGVALSPAPEKQQRRKRSQLSGHVEGTGYEDDDEFVDDDEDEDEEEGDDDILFEDASNRRTRRMSYDALSGKKSPHQSNITDLSKATSDPSDVGLQLLHLGCTSISSHALQQLLFGLGQDSPIRELSIPSNNIGPEGATLLVEFLEGKGILKYKKGQVVMPKLDRLDMSNNNLGNDGTAKLTRAISKRAKVNIVDLRLSSNSIGAGGVETMLNKLLQHNLVSLSLDNNMIGDRGCQLVAASVPSMRHLARVNLGFNQIGSRGVTTLMRALVGSESISYLGLSGNVMKISGAIAMGFALAQHPRLAELELDNCCLSQVAQCHIVAGIVSNRWVPMRRVNGFRVGPPMVAIGALEALAQHLSNEECFRIRRNIQMKTILQWMESNRAAKMSAGTYGGGGPRDKFLTADFVSGMNDVNGAPSQNAYLRMLDWLSRIPFDEDELNDLRRYFYDADGGEGSDGLRGSDGNINLKHRGDLLAALGSVLADEVRHLTPTYESEGPAIGLDIDYKQISDDDDWTVPEVWKYANNVRNSQQRRRTHSLHSNRTLSSGSMPDLQNNAPSGKRRRQLQSDGDSNGSLDDSNDVGTNFHSEQKESDRGMSSMASSNLSMNQRSSVSSLSKQSAMSRSESEKSTYSQGERGSGGLKARITMFPQFAAKLDMLKESAQEMMDTEEDPAQQDIIAQQFAEASLTLLRQLRYHCMNSGLDGWRQGKIRRKVLIVDDSKITRKMVSRAFEKANFIVDTAVNGMEGVAKLKESIYDIAFMDIDMPVMNGFDATKALRDWEDRKRPGARQPICALTAAYVDDFERDELMKFKEAGLDVMESKPCNIPRLFKVVDDVSPMFSDLSISMQQTAASY